MKRFAEMMIAHHSKANEKQAELLKKLNVTATENPKSAALRDESQKALELLEATTSTAFDMAYIDLQVNEHEQVLDSIDNLLLHLQVDIGHVERGAGRRLE